MDNDNTTPLLVAGKMPKTCYEDVNELIADIAKVLRIPFDTYTVIKGAEGIPGKTVRGPSGVTGPAGPAGSDASMYVRKVPIPLGATFVDFNTFIGYDRASFSIHHKGQIGSLIPDPPIYNPGTAGIVGIGTVIGIAPSAAVIRVFFLFGGGITTVPDINHVLHICSTSPIS